MSRTVEAVAAQLTRAYDGSDLALLEPLLDPGVRWGGEHDTPETCHSRQDVLAWYGREHAAGASARVTETVVRERGVVLGLELTGPAGRPRGQRPGHVFQVFRLRDGLIVDIRGAQDRDRALELADAPLGAGRSWWRRILDRLRR